MLLGPTSSTAVTLNPHPDLLDRIYPVQPENSRAINGQMHRANEAKYQQWRFKVGFVPASSAAIVQSWWTSQASLYLWPDPIAWPNSAYQVALMNTTQPLDRWTFPYYGVYREGDLIIESRSAF